MEREEAAERLYAMAPNARITSVLADVHRWTGFANAFTHLQYPSAEGRLGLSLLPP